MPANLFEAITERDVEAVRGMLNVKWDHVKWRRLEVAKSGPTEGFSPVSRALYMCVGDMSSKKKHERETSFKIFDILVETGVDIGFVVTNNLWYLFSLALPYCGAHAGWPRIFQICCQHGFSFMTANPDNVLSHLAALNFVDVLKVLVEYEKPVLTQPLLDVCTRYPKLSVEFCEVFLRCKAPEFWLIEPSGWPNSNTIDQMILNLAVSSNTDLLKLLIQHGLPPTTHHVLVHLTDARMICSQEFFSLLLEHTSPDSKLLQDRSMSYWAHDHIFSWAFHPDRIQELRDHPRKKLMSWSKTMHPGHTLRGDDCSLCYDLYKAGQKIVKLPCGHVFHLECMLNCVPMKQDTCPYCRTRYI